MFRKESNAIGTSHALDILGEYPPSPPALPFLERVGTSPAVQVNHSLINPQKSEPIERGKKWPPLPEPTSVEKPAGEPPLSWHQLKRTEGVSSKDTASTGTIVQRPPAQSGEVARQQAAALAQSRVSTVEPTRPPAPPKARVTARAEAATLAQSGASKGEQLRGPRKREGADQSTGTRKASKITQGSAFEHVERKPKKPSISWANPVSTEFANRHAEILSIDRVESILRTRRLRNDQTAQHNTESDYKDTGKETNQQTNRETNSSQRAFPSNLISIIKEIRKEVIPAPTAPEFVFELTSEAAEKNFMILKKYDFDLGKAIAAQGSSPLGYGSEFRPPATLQKIFQSHPLWQRMERLLIEGSKWPLLELSEEDRIADLLEALQFGNHKGASERPELLKKLISDDIRFGYGLVVPRRKITRLPNACLAPMNIMNQFTLDASGEIVDKERLTHDQSFQWQSGMSVNKRVTRENLQRCMYGRCLMRLLCWIVAARRKFPNRPIALQKIDIKSAYRRCHLNAITAMQTITQLPEDELGIIMLRLTFGGAPCPFEWNIISESIRDLANEILFDENWDPSEIHARCQHLVPTMKLLDDSISYAEGKELIVDIPVDARGTGDVYIDDLIQATVVIEGTDNAIRCERATLLAIETVARPKDEKEPIPREDMEARNKLEAEAGFEELKTVLGWLLDTRRLLVKLPKNKFIAWSNIIREMIQRGTTTAKELESIIGRLVHLGMAIPLVYHFLSRIRDLLVGAKRRRAIRISGECLKDLELMMQMIQIAHEGVSMNSIVYRRPTHVYRSDSCPAGLGGYSDSGFAWRFYLSEGLKFRATNNLLEHIAAIITPWIDIIRGRLKPGDCALSMTDSTTSEGWLRKTNFSELREDPEQATVRLEVARLHATHYITLGIREYSQWFKGEDNVVADSLSRDDDRTDEELTNLFRTFCKSQIPEHFEIQPLPNEIVSWLTALLLRLQEKPQLREKHTRTKLGRGSVGSHTAAGLDWRTPSLTNSPAIQESSYSEPLPWLCAKHDFQEHLMSNWLRDLSQVPSHMYLRPSVSTADPTQPWTTTERLDSFYNGN